MQAEQSLGAGTGEFCRHLIPGEVRSHDLLTTSALTATGTRKVLWLGSIDVEADQGDWQYGGREGNVVSAHCELVEPGS